MEASAETIAAALSAAERSLAAADDEHPRLSAEWLLAEICGCSRGELHLNRDRRLDPDVRERYDGMIERRIGGEPLQYIAGRAPFRSLEIGVDASVLIPRPETEGLVDVFLDALDGAGASDVLPEIVADIGCGSGCIALSIAAERPSVHVLATDVSIAALERAEANAREFALEGRIEFLHGDMFDALAAQADHSLAGIISNPPYIPTALLETLPEEVIGFEPRWALDGGVDGLDFLRVLLDGSSRLLRRGGVLAVELFETTLDEAAGLARKAGFTSAEIHRDLAGRERVLLARWE